jgi:hypothetical protein
MEPLQGSETLLVPVAIIDGTPPAFKTVFHTMML